MRANTRARCGEDENLRHWSMRVVSGLPGGIVASDSIARWVLGAMAGLCLIFAGAPVDLWAATISSDTFEADGVTVSVIIVEGELLSGDELVFAEHAIRLREAIVWLASPGGNLNAGIEIGKSIRLRGYKTVAMDAQSCASACALAWLGGVGRIMGEDGAVGFHAAWVQEGMDARADSVGNALVGAYLNGLGMTQNAIAYMTQAEPDGMTWLSFEDARALGIDVAALDPPKDGQGTMEQPSRGTPPTDDWAAYGEWIQIYSRAAINEAIQLGIAYRREFPATFVFRYENGWYVVALGPYPPGAARRERDALARTGRIPNDSLVTDGGRFMELLWGDTPRGGIAMKDTGAQRALAAAEAFFDATSGTRSVALAYLDRVYPAWVDYYGRRTARVDVLEEKRTFIDRWPVRRYVLREGAGVACRSNGECVVEGLVDWSNRSVPRKATSTGVARFTLLFRPQGQTLMLAGETSAVLSRDVRERR